MAAHRSGDVRWSLVWPGSRGTAAVPGARSRRPGGASRGVAERVVVVVVVRGTRARGLQGPRGRGVKFTTAAAPRAAPGL
eukprot:scaffold15644_cov63-Phaeocystis_antarctica.AAC.2